MPNDQTAMSLQHRIGERIADEVEKIAHGRQSNCERAAKDILAMVEDRLTQAEADLASARKALEEMLAAYGPWTGKTAKQEHADEAAREALVGLPGPRSDDLSIMRGEAEDYYPSHEALHDLVSLLSEHDALNGGGPGWAERWKRALLNAEDLVRIEP